jgi:hypothetical protein
VRARSSGLSPEVCVGIYKKMDMITVAEAGGGGSSGGQGTSYKEEDTARYTPP